MRKSIVYFFVLAVVAAWFILIIWLSYKDDRLFTPISYSSFKRASPSEFELYCQLNPRPGLPVPEPGAAVAVVATLKNKTVGAKTQLLLVPSDEFSCLRLQVFPVGADKPTYETLMGEIPRADVDAGDVKSRLPTWHTLAIGPMQSIGKEIVLPQRAFPKPGDYKIVLHWLTDDRARLEGNVAPIDRDSLVLDLQTEQVVHLVPSTLPKPNPQPHAVETAPPHG